jgi:hypothetical protein
VGNVRCPRSGGRSDPLKQIRKTGIAEFKTQWDTGTIGLRDSTDTHEFETLQMDVQFKDDIHKVFQAPDRHREQAPKLILFEILFAAGADLVSYHDTCATFHTERAQRVLEQELVGLHLLRRRLCQRVVGTRPDRSQCCTVFGAEIQGPGVKCVTAISPRLPGLTERPLDELRELIRSLNLQGVEARAIRTRKEARLAFRVKQTKTPQLGVGE